MDNIEDIETKYTTSSVIVCRTPCWLYTVICTESSTTAKLLSLIDGVVSTGKIKFKVSASSYSDGYAVFNKPIYFKHGLYLGFESGLETAFVQFKREY